MSSPFTLLLVVLICFRAGEPALADSSETIKVEQIEITGLQRTEPFVIKRELPFSEGDIVTIEAIAEGLQRIRNTQLFVRVEHSIEKKSSLTEGAVLRIELEERWTTIPIAKFSSGGGVNRYTLGAYDVHVLGRYLELGGQYERLGSENSGVVWLRQPRLFNQRLELFLSLWDITRAETVYADLGKSNKIEGGLLVKRKRASVALEKEWLWWLKLGLILDYNRDTCSPNLLDTDEPAMRSEILANHERETTAVLPGVSLRIGRLNHSGFLIDGVLFEHKTQVNNQAVGGTSNFSLNETSLVAFKTGPSRSTLALRLGAGWTDSETAQYYFFLGGLDRIRGYEAGRFYGRSYWTANTEYRQPFLERPLYILQGTGFVDALGIAHRQSEVDEITAASVGAGIRLIAPKIYRLTLRLDYARGIVQGGTQPINFGIQQFF